MHNMLDKSAISIKYLLDCPATKIYPGVEHIQHDLQLVLVVGCPRSGTTVLGNCLGKAHNACTSEESLFLINMRQTFSDLTLGANRRQYAPLSHYGLSSPQVLRLIKQFSDQVFSTFLQTQKKEVFVDHTPWYGLLLGFMVSLYPDAKVLHVLRNGDDVAASLGASYRNGFAWAGETSEERKEFHRRFVAAVQEQSLLLGERYHEVSYEAFCAQPEEVLQKLCDSLGLTYHPDVLAATKVPYASPSRPHIFSL